MLYTKCPACGVVLRGGTGNVSVCPRCLRGFRSNTPSFSVPAVQPAPAQTKAQAKAEPKSQAIAGLLIMLIVFGFAGGVFALPAIMVLTVMIVKLSIDSVREEHDTEPNQSSSPAKTPADFRRQLSDLPLESMPLGKYGMDADAQIQLLEKQKRALTEMLGPDHPFQKNAADAAQYVMNNCKQIVYRLRYCDQSDPSFCRIHAEYMQQRLQENARVLRDFEKLIIEVTQMNQDIPVQEPCLDVLADTLRNIRTQETAVPQQRMMQ